MIAFHPGRSNGRTAVTVPSAAALLADLETRLSAGEGFAVATLNLDHVVKLRRDPAFRAAYARHGLVTADGNPIVWLHRLAGRRIELVQGADLVRPVAALAGRLGIRVGLLGATGPTLHAAAARLEAECPGLEIVTRIAPPPRFDPEGAAADACLEQLRAAGVGLCFVALGAPKQERLAARGLERVPGCGFVSIGAGLDFLAGGQKRAPPWVRRIAMEWAWRMLGNPRRLARRYARCALVLPQLAAEAAQARRESA